MREAYAERRVKKSVERGRKERRAEAYLQGCVEDRSDARTLLAGGFTVRYVRSRWRL